MKSINCISENTDAGFAITRHPAEYPRQALNWQPARFDLETIIEDAWKWEEKPASKPAYA